MELESARQLAQSLRWASNCPPWEGWITQVHGAGATLSHFRWLEDTPNEGAFKVVRPGRQSLNLAVADEYERGDYYLAVYTSDTSNTFAELHNTDLVGGVECLTWRYSPSKQDGRNGERKALFSRMTGSRDLRVPLPVRSTDRSVREFLDDLYYLVDAKLAADALDDGVELEPAEFPEGRVVERRHWARERNTQVVALAKSRRLEEQGKLACDCCGFDFHAVYGKTGIGFIEAHHTLPVSEMEEGDVTRVEDLALVCANCHRMLHRARPWRSIEELQKRMLARSP